MNKEEIQEQIKELQDKINVLSSELEKCKKPILSIRKPELGKNYYLIFSNSVDSYLNQNDTVDNIYFESGNYWFTKKRSRI